MSAQTSIPIVSGSYFDFVDLDRNEVIITDIAHALANVCKFGGHTREFFSVAQHSVLVSQVVPPAEALPALFLDADKAYMGMTNVPEELTPELMLIQKRVRGDIFQKLGLPLEISDAVRAADLILRATEHRDLMPQPSVPWELIAGVTPLAKTIVPLPPTLACLQFIERYKEIVAPMIASMPVAINNNTAGNA